MSGIREVRPQIGQFYYFKDFLVCRDCGQNEDV